MNGQPVIGSALKPASPIPTKRAKPRALEDWRHGLLNDLGGIEQTSTQQRQIIDLSVKTKLILDSIDAYLIKQPSLVNHRKRSLLPVVLQRQQLADALSRYMQQIGLKRVAKPALSIQDYITKRRDDEAGASSGETPESTPGAEAEVEHKEGLHA